MRIDRIGPAAAVVAQRRSERHASHVGIDEAHFVAYGILELLAMRESVFHGNRAANLCRRGTNRHRR